MTFITIGLGVFFLALALGLILQQDLPDQFVHEFDDSGQNDVTK